MTSPIATDETWHAGLWDCPGDFETEVDQTGWELGGAYRVFHFTHHGGGKSHAYALGAWGSVLAEAEAEVRVGEELSDQAAAFAREMPQVESRPLPAPRLTGNLAEDVHAVCGLTWDQIAGVFKVSERAAAGWRMQGVPAHRVETMEALRAIGSILVGGLGPDGVARWLTTGEPSRLERLRDGEVEAVAAEARSYLDTPAT